MDAVLSARDRHLFGPGGKRILALGGAINSGVTAIVSLAFLERIESLLGESVKETQRLGDHFDLVGGASASAMVAAAVALGYGAAQIKDFLLKLVPLAVKRSAWRLPLFQPKFDARALRAQLEAMVGDRSISSPDLVTGLCIIMKRIDTGAPWVLSNNPRAPYWMDAADYIGNKQYPLVNLIRASAAAPHFFDPELLPISAAGRVFSGSAAQPFAASWPVRALQTLLERTGLRRQIQIDPNAHGLFIDGTLTPHCNPSLALLDMVTFRAYGLDWPKGPDRLTICSIGTGRRRYRLEPKDVGAATARLAMNALLSLMTESEDAVLTQMQYLGECPTPWTASDTGIGPLDEPQGGKICRFLHYDIELESEWLKDNLGETVSARDITRLRQLDDPAIANELYAIARIAAGRQVKPEHFI